MPVDHSGNPGAAEFARERLETTFGRDREKISFAKLWELCQDHAETFQYLEVDYHMHH